MKIILFIFNHLSIVPLRLVAEPWMILRLLWFLVPFGVISVLRVVCFPFTQCVSLHISILTYSSSVQDQSYAAAIHSQGNKQPYLNQQQPYGQPTGHGQRPKTLEEIEAELHRTAGYRGQIPMGDPQAAMMAANQGPGKKMLTMAEVEAALLAQGASPNANGSFQQQQQQQQQQPPYGYGNVDPAQMMALRQQQELLEQMSAEKELKRREQLRQMAEKVRH
jgi:hypothetical protein